MFYFSFVVITFMRSGYAECIEVWHPRFATMKYLTEASIHFHSVSFYTRYLQFNFFFHFLNLSVLLRVDSHLEAIFLSLDNDFFFSSFVFVFNLVFMGRWLKVFNHSIPSLQKRLPELFVQKERDLHLRSNQKVIHLI